MEIEILSALSSLGVGCILALVIFFMYRRECKSHREQMTDLLSKHRDDRIFMEDRLTKLLDGDQKSRTENTEALTQLITYLKKKNGRVKAR